MLDARRTTDFFLRRRVAMKQQRAALTPARLPGSPGPHHEELAPAKLRSGARSFPRACGHSNTSRRRGAITPNGNRSGQGNQRTHCRIASLIHCPGVHDQVGEMMKIYKGGCHCGLVRFEFRKVDPIEMIMDCNCSICQMKGLVHTGVEDEEMTILSGEAELSLYQFGSKTAKYWFCPRCGVNPFNRSRTNPHRYTVNVRCLDDFDDLVESCGVWFINGRDHPLDRDSEVFEGRPNPIRANSGPVPSSRIVMRPRRG